MSCVHQINDYIIRNMKKVGIIGDNEYENKIKIKEILFNLKQKYGTDVEIVSRGSIQGAERYIKKYALELGLSYKEFNPPHSTYNLYSAMNESFYNKPYKPFNFILRDKIFSSYVDVCFCLTARNNSPSIKTCLEHLDKNNKKYVIVN